MWGPRAGGAEAPPFFGLFQHPARLVSCNIRFLTPPHPRPLSPKGARGEKDSHKYFAFTLDPDTLQEARPTERRIHANTLHSLPPRPFGGEGPGVRGCQESDVTVPTKREGGGATLPLENGMKSLPRHDNLKT